MPEPAEVDDVLGPPGQRFVAGILALAALAIALVLGEQGRVPLALALLLPLLSPVVVHGPLRRRRRHPRVELDGRGLLLDGLPCLVQRVAGVDEHGRTIAVVRRQRRDVLGAFPVQLDPPARPENVALVAGSAFSRGLILSLRIAGIVLVLLLLSGHRVAAPLVGWILWPILVIVYVVLAMDAFASSPSLRIDLTPRFWQDRRWTVLRGPVRDVAFEPGALILRGDSETVRIRTTALPDRAAVDRLARLLVHELSAAPAQTEQRVTRS